MRKLYPLATIMLSLMYGCSQPQLNTDIRINQLGYLPKQEKEFVVVNSSSKEFTVEKDGKDIFTGTLEDKGEYKYSGEKLRTGNFSQLNDTGTFVIKVKDKGISYPFRISSDVYDKVSEAALKSYYFMRASMPIEEKYAGKYARVEGHPDTVVYYHPSSGHNSGFKSSPKGWYDAGDYNKYIVNGGFTVSTLLSAFELFPADFNDNLNIPESGNKVSDLLDEVKYELDWMFTMQDNDGGVFQKLTNKKFDAFDSPDKCTNERFIVGKGTAATLNLAAAMAQAARVYKPIDAAFADKCLTSATKAYNWALANPNVEFKNPADVLTGEYGDKNFLEEFHWAAAELYVTTGKPEYLKEVTKRRIPFFYFVGDNWRQFVGNLAYFSLLSDKSPLPENEKGYYKEAILQAADNLLANADAYGINLNEFNWASNSDVLDAALIFAYAYQINHNPKFLNMVVKSTDYIFGKNATGYSFITGFGSKTPMFPHHRLSASDTIVAPIPGFLVGGPNSARQDEGAGPDNVVYTFKEPAKSYMDIQKSYASNEVAINWNAPLVFVTYYLKHNGK